jgi:hypothetical protein
LVIKQEFERLLREIQEKPDVTDLSEEQNKVVKGTRKSVRIC